METLDSLAEELAERDGQIADLCRRLAYSYDLLIEFARSHHAAAGHDGDSWAGCNQWPCRNVGMEIVRRER